jgi:hypothetical protein
MKELMNSKGEAIMLYRIMTENVNGESIKAMVGKQFDGFTMFSAKGVWKGIEESSLIVEVVSELPIIKKVKALARRIKKLNNQEAVLVEVLQNNSFLL